MLRGDVGAALDDARFAHRLYPDRPESALTMATAELGRLSGTSDRSQEMSRRLGRCFRGILERRYDNEAYIEAAQELLAQKEYDLARRLALSAWRSDRPAAPEADQAKAKGVWVPYLGARLARARRKQAKAAVYWVAAEAYRIEGRLIRAEFASQHFRKTDWAAVQARLQAGRKK